MKKYVFGPVASRRLGKSLGVDLLYKNICSFDCLYCECGKTEILTDERSEYVNTKEVISEIKEVLDSGIKVDYVTFSGSGEPTLHSGIGEIISFLKKYNVKIALLTNSSLLWREDVQNDIMDVDIIVPTLNSVFQKTFGKINIPNQNINIELIKKGLKDFSKKFKGSIFVETLVCQGLNDTDDEINGIIEYLKDVNFEKIQINTVVRPPAYSIVKPVNSEKINSIRDMFLKAGLNCEIIGNAQVSDKGKFDRDEFLRTVEIRPLTMDDIQKLFSDNMDKIEQELNYLVKKRVIFKDGDFFRKRCD